MIKIEIRQGSIIDLQVDAIVNPANSFGVMGGGVAGVIKAVGGAMIEAEAVKNSPIELGKAIITDAGMLPSRYVIHSPTMERPADVTTEQNIKKSVNAALAAADEKRLKTIAMPGMGTGVGGFEPIDAAKLIVDEIKKFRPDFLSKVILIDVSQDMVKAFEDALN